MFDKKELATIMGALVSESVEIQHTIEREDYVCEEELESLKRQLDITDKLAHKVSKLINE